MAVAGLLIGYATLVRSVGEPLLVVALVGMLARRVGWLRLAGPRGDRRRAHRRVHALVPRYVRPVRADRVLGPFLYSRVSTFAECSKINLPADLRFLCDPNPPQDRPPAGEYIWADNDLPVNGKVTYTPLYQWSHYHPDTSLRFTATMNAKTRQFAERAIEAQPAAYAGRGHRRHPAHVRLDPAAGPERLVRERPAFPVLISHATNLEISRLVRHPFTTGNPQDQPHSPSPTWCDATCQKGAVRRG